MTPGGQYPLQRGLGIDALNAEWVAADIYNENGTE